MQITITKNTLTMRSDLRSTANLQPNQTSRSCGIVWWGCAAMLSVLIFVCGCQRNAVATTFSAVLDVDATNFEQEVLRSDQPVLVEIWAPWCQPCLEMAPDIERVATEFSGRAKVVRTRIDENEDLVAKIGINAPPAVVLYTDGKVTKIRHGRQSAEALAALLRDSLEHPRSDQLSETKSPQ